MPVITAAGRAFTWLSWVPFLGSEDGAKYLPLAHSCLTAVIVLTLAWLARMAMMRAPKGREGLLPEANL